MKIYYIANKSRQEFMYIDENPYSVHIYTAATIFTSISRCLLAWYSPILPGKGTATQRLPRTNEFIIARNDMFIYTHNIITNTITKAPLPVIDYRCVSLPELKPIHDSIPDDSLIAPASYITTDGVFCKKQSHGYANIRMNTLFIFE